MADMSELVACLKRLHRRPVTEILHTLFTRCLSTSGTSLLANIIPPCVLPGDLVSCLVAVENLLDDALSKQALLIEYENECGE